MLKTENGKVIAPSGASSSTEAHRYDMVPKAAWDCMADRWELGRITHSPESLTNDNWLKGINDKWFITNRLNCMMEHLLCIMNKDFSEDDEWGHLGAIMWGCAFRAYILNKKHEDSLKQEKDDDYDDYLSDVEPI